VPDQTGASLRVGQIARGAKAGKPIDRRAAKGAAPRVLAVRSVVGAGLVAWALLAPAAPAPSATAAPGRGDPAARLPSSRFAGDYWDLVARFESGHAVLAIASITHLGPAGRHAAVVGQLLLPDGTVERFSRTESAGGFSLSEGGRRLDLRSIVFDPRGPVRRFLVDKDELELELALRAGEEPLWPEEAVPGCSLDVLEIDAEVSGSYWLPGMEARAPLRGRAALTHRWTPGLEVECMRRGVELFVLEGELSIYFHEVLTPDDRRLRWLVVRRGGRVLHRGAPEASELRFRPGAAEFPQLEKLQFTAPGVSGQVEFADPLGAFEPLARMPSPLRWVLGQRTRPQLTWSTPRFEITLEEGRRRRTFAGAGIAKLSYTNPFAPGPVRARPARDAGPADGEG
jgi:hypothetical protein